jgi:uncharacterized membrane protein YcfT
MPLFFFASGIFAAKALKMDWRSFLQSRIAHLVYLYIIWSHIIFYARSARMFLQSDGFPLMNPLSIFWDPPWTIWFIYALIAAYGLAWLLRGVNKWLVLSVAALAYAVDVSSGAWTGIDFVSRIIRLFPLFMLAMYFKDEIIAAVRRYDRFWPALVFASLLGGYVTIQSTTLSGIAPLTLAISLSGILGVMTFCHRFQDTWLVEGLAWIGSRTIHIYLMHRVYLEFSYAGWGKFFGKEFSALDHTVMFVTSIVACLLVGHYVLRPFFPWLERAPWLPGRPRQAAAAA